MNHNQLITSRVNARIVGLVLAAALLAMTASPVLAKPLPQAKPAAATRLEVTAGTVASYRVREQLAGLSFGDDAIGSTDTISGTLTLLPDGSFNTAQSRLTIDLRNLKSDQDMRDGYVKQRTLETDKFPTAEFVPRRIQGLPSPLPSSERPTDQTGFQLVGDLTVHGVTKEVTLNGYATMSRDLVAGRATTEFTFSTFGIAKPQLARLLSVDDKIQLDLVFKLKRTN